MAWTRPTIKSLLESSRASITSSLILAGYRVDATIARTPLRILSDVFSGGLHLLYGLLAYVARQLVPGPDMALDYLVAHARLYGLERKPAAVANGVFRITGTNTTVIPSGSLVVRADGALFNTTAEGTITTGEAFVEAVAQTAGAGGNLQLGSTLQLGVTIVGADPTVTAYSGWSNGTDTESATSLLERLLQRIRQTPQGGARKDYDRWARSLAGIYRTQVVPNARGAGTVDVFFLHEEGTGIGIPTEGQIEDAQEFIDEVRPVTADVLMRAPTATGVAYTFALLEPDTSETRAAIQAELDALYARKALTSQTVHVSDHWQAAIGAAGVTAVEITTPSAPLVPDQGQVFTRGVITWPS